MPINPQDRLKNTSNAQQPSDNDLDALDPSDDEGSKVSSTGNFQKIMYGAAALAVVIVIVICFMVFSKDKPQQVAVGATTTTQSTGAGTGKETANSDKPWLNQPAVSPGAEKTPAPTDKTTPSVTTKVDGPPSTEVSPGITDISQDVISKNYASVEPDTFVKDLNGLPVDENYVIDNIGSAVDFVSYTKKRATTGDGVELYWLEAEYKGKPAKIQVSFKIFKELDPVGVTAVDVEVVRVKDKDGKKHEIATNFVVRTDYKKLLEQRKTTK